MKTILYISPAIFPYGGAYSSRLQNFVRLFYLLGFKTHIISDYSYEKSFNFGKVQKFEDVTYQALANTVSPINRIKCSFISVSYFKKYLSENSVDLVILGNCYDRFSRMRHICKKKNIPCVLEIGEWYDTQTRRLGLLNPYNVIYNRVIKSEYIKSDAVITISRYLENYFLKYTDKVVRIPTILDVENMDYSVQTSNEKIRIVQIGFSGTQKEKYDNIFLALKKLGKDMDKFEYLIYGSDEETVLKNIDNNRELLNDVSACVKIKGRIPQTEVHSIYKNADYSIFIRPIKKSNEAGFPTKLAESMMAGTPVITNKTGDIDLYLHNKLNGYLLKDNSTDSIVKIFQLLLTKTKLDVKKQRIAARKEAMRSFDFRNYTEKLSNLFESLINNKAI